MHLQWTDEFTDALEVVKEEFGLPHQDSKKHEDMIATLVIVPPSDHTGGELVIHHESGTLTHRGRRRGLSLVTSGQRVVVTYDLLWGGPAPAPAGEATTRDLARSLTEHFTTPTAARYGGRAGDPPSRLVHLLDHEYTEQGMDWSHLKGVDAVACPNPAW